MEVTQASKNDLNEISRLFESAKKQMEQSKIYQWTSIYPNKKIIEIDIEKHRLFKLVNKNQIVTVATLDNESQGNFTIRRIATEPNHLSNGYASLLLGDIISKVKQKKGKHIYSSTNHTNVKMQNFFNKHGFEKISEYTEIEREHLGSFYKYLKKI